MSVYIGIPTYNGLIHHTTVSGLVQTAHFCGSNKVGIGVEVIPHDAFVGRARNLIVKKFLDSGFHELLFVDADVGFDVHGVIDVCKAPAEIVMGLYRMKEDGPDETKKEKYSSAMFDPIERHPENPRLIKIQYGPAGFMRVRRTVFEKMIEKYPNEWYSDDNGKLYDFFPSGRTGNNFNGEDISFCQRAQSCGFDIWAMQGIPLKHHGEKSWGSNWQIDIGQNV